MKKVSYFLGAALLLAGSYVFVGCGGDDSATPTIDVLLNGTRQNSIEVEYDATVKLEITWKAEGNIDKIDLNKKVGGSGSNVQGYPKSSGFKLDTEDTYTVDVTNDSGGTTAYTVVFSTSVTDKNSGDAGAQTTTQDITITFKAKGTGPNNPTETPLVAGSDFTLKYTGSSQSDGQNVNTTVGIKWSLNPTGSPQKARFIPEPSTGKFVVLTQAEYDAITTKEALGAKYEGGTGVDKIETNTAAYLITKTGSNYYLVNLKTVSFAAGNNTATFSYKN